MGLGYVELFLKFRAYGVQGVGPSTRSPELFLAGRALAPSVFRAGPPTLSPKP